MMMRAVFVFALVAAVTSEQKSYKGHKVLRTEPLDREGARFLQNLQVTTSYDFWKDPMVGQFADVMAGPGDIEDLKNLLSEMGIKFSTMIEDVDQVIEETRPSGRSTGMDWDDYHSIDEINDFITGIASNNGFAEVINIGQTYEKRDLKVLALRKAGAGKPNIWLEAGIHAREWIAPAVATYIINELVTNYADHPFMTELNWYLLPSLNPDGYAYSHSTDRLWRKNRSPQEGSCDGVDLNRNFGFHWGESGVSHEACSEVFCGPAPESELEAQHVEAFVKTLDPVPVFANCFHSYSQLWLWPYGYDYGAYPSNWREVKDLAEKAAQKLGEVHGTYFDPINSADLYPAAGAADDWYKGNLSARYVYTTELRDTGFYGFVLPKEQIRPSGEEMWAAFQYVAQRMIEETSQH